MDEIRNQVEAILFALGKDVTIEEVARLSKLELEKAKGILQELKTEYDLKDGALKLVDKGNFWKFTIKDRYLPLVSNLIAETELDKSTMETLAVIAWKYPILQSDVIKIRHNKAYEHMHRLKELGFINKEKNGRTFKIHLTDKFFSYFDLPTQDAKEAFRRVIPPEIQQEMLAKEKEIEEKEKIIETRKEEEEVKKAAQEEAKKNLPKLEEKPTEVETETEPEVEQETEVAEEKENSE